MFLTTTFARQKAGDVRGDQAGADIDAAARVVAADNVDGLAGVEVGGRLCRRVGGHQRCHSCGSKPLDGFTPAVRTFHPIPRSLRGSTARQ